MKLELSVRNSRVHSNRDDDYVTLKFEDTKSGVRFLEMKFSLKEWGDLVSGNGEVRVQGEVKGLDNLGKTYVHEPRSIIIPYVQISSGAYSAYEDQKKAIGDWLKANAAEEGWTLNTYLGSQKSITRDHNSSCYRVNYSVFKWE